MDLNNLRVALHAEKQAIEAQLTAWQTNLAEAQRAQRIAEMQVFGCQVDLKRLEWVLVQMETDAAPPA